MEGGWILEDMDCEPLKHSGGSAAQSSLIQVQDAFFQIFHPNDTFLKDMRSYMPKKHREYILYCERRMNIIDYMNIKSIVDDEINELINNCITAIKDFRYAHFGIVNKYIKQQIKSNDESTNESTNSKPIVNANNCIVSNNKADVKADVEADTNLSQDKKVESKMTGTGGTDFEVYLKNLIKDTKNSLIKYKSNKKPQINNKICLLYTLLYTVLSVCILYHLYTSSYLYNSHFLNYTSDNYSIFDNRFYSIDCDDFNYYYDINNTLYCLDD